MCTVDKKLYIFPSQSDSQFFSKALLHAEIHFDPNFKKRKGKKISVPNLTIESRKRKNQA